MIWDTLLQGLGSILAFFYRLIPSYGVAIILLTILVRVVLLPLTIRQTRSMQAMQKLQPKIKELQRKHKGNRQKLNEEMMKLYKEHQVNPLGGCLPLLLQLPVFFALFSVLRSPIQTTAIPVETGTPAAPATAEGVLCAPNTEATLQGPGPDTVVCTGPDQEQTYAIKEWRDPDTGDAIEPQPYLIRCVPATSDEGEGENKKTVLDEFTCQSILGTKHLPEDSRLFADVIEDNTTFLGIHLACTPTQATSTERIQECSPGSEGGGPALILYYGLVALMVASTWYQQRQMQRASAGTGQQPQMQMMSRIMPVFLGVISISMAAGVLVYWVTTNTWQIGQQYLMLQRRAREGEAVRVKGERGDGSRGSSGVKGGPAKGGPKPPAKGDGRPRGGRSAGSRKKRRKR